MSDIADEDFDRGNAVGRCGGDIDVLEKLAVDAADTTG